MQAKVLAAEAAHDVRPDPVGPLITAGFSREDFIYNEIRDIYTCPAGKTLIATGHVSTDHTRRYLGSVAEWRAVLANSEVLPEHTSATDRPRCERGRTRCRSCPRQNGGVRAIARNRKKVEMLFARLKRILRLGRLPPSRRQWTHSSSSRWQRSHKT